MELTQEEMSYNTKSAMASALKIRLKTTPFGKISVKEITEDCDINRQTFYYHFKDMYDLLHWAFLEDMKEVVTRQNHVLIWQDALYLIFDYLQNNKEIALNAYHSIGNEHFRQLLYNNIYGIFHKTVESAFESINISDKAVDFYTYYCITSMSGILESWLSGMIDYSPDEIISYTEDIIRAQIEGAKTVYGIK